MAIVTTNDQHYSDIADAIRDKGVNGVFKPNEMASAIQSISTGITPSGRIEITENGDNIDVSQYSLAYVNVNGEFESANSTVYVEQVTVGANNITTADALVQYLMALIANPDGANRVGIFVQKKESYANNTVDKIIGNSATRLQSGTWGTIQVNNQWNAHAEPGDIYEVIYYVV